MAPNTVSGCQANRVSKRQRLEPSVRFGGRGGANGDAQSVRTWLHTVGVETSAFGLPRKCAGLRSHVEHRTYDATWGTGGLVRWMQEDASPLHTRK